MPKINLVVYSGQHKIQFSTQGFKTPERINPLKLGEIRAPASHRFLDNLEFQDRVLKYKINYARALLVLFYIQ